MVLFAQHFSTLSRFVLHRIARQRLVAADANALASIPGWPRVSRVSPTAVHEAQSTQLRFDCIAVAMALSALCLLGDSGHLRSTQLEENASNDAETDIVMSADCGGTTSRLRLYAVPRGAVVVEGQEAPGRLILEEKYPNVMFKSLESIIETFLKTVCDELTPRPVIAVLAVAGIVTNNQCRFTNLDWVVDGHELAHNLGIGRVEILNDFVAQGYGTLTLADADLLKLNGATPRQGAPIACIGAGTGLGKCFLTADPTGSYRCYPSEGGHAEFAPRGEGSDELQMELLKYLKVKFSGWNRISVERVVSGKGICNIYEFLAYKYPRRVNKQMFDEYNAQPGDASIIARNATPGSLCEETLKIFTSCYGATCGSLAIDIMPFRGLFITGGVSKRLAHMLQDDGGEFMSAFHDKGRVSPLVDQVPVYLVKNDDMGQRGAHFRSVVLLHEHLSGHHSRVEKASGLSKEDLPAPRETVFAENSALSDLVLEFQENNRRLVIESERKSEHEPVFKTMLWRLTRGADQLKEDGWLKRDMWIARNGSLVLWSDTKQDGFVYFNAKDMQSATITKLRPNETCKKWAFSVRPKGFKQAIFAAESETARDVWIEQLLELKVAN